MTLELQQFTPLLHTGDYLVVEDTNLDGHLHAVWPGWVLLPSAMPCDAGGAPGSPARPASGGAPRPGTRSWSLSP